VLLTLGADGVVLDSDEAPPNAVRAGGQLEFTCLLPERDTKRNAWVVPLAVGHVVAVRCHLISLQRVCDSFRIASWLTRTGRSLTLFHCVVDFICLLLAPKAG